MKQETFAKAKRLQEQIDFLASQIQALKLAQNKLLESKCKPDDVMAFVAELMKCLHGDYVLSEVVQGIVTDLNNKIHEKEAEFEAL